MQEETVREARHFHGWPLTTMDGQTAYVALPGTYALDMTARRHARAASGGDQSQVLETGRKLLPLVIMSTPISKTKRY